MNEFFGYITSYDISLMRVIHHSRPVVLDTTFYYISFSTTIVSVLILGFALYTSLKNKSIEAKRRFFKLLLVFIVVTVVSLLLKTLIYRERPFYDFPDIEKLSEAGSSSFPSGHTMEVFAIAFTIFICFQNRLFTMLAFFWAVTVAYTRIALGVHYPFDVLAGALLGIAVSYLVIKAFNRLEIKIK